MPPECPICNQPLERDQDQCLDKTRNAWVHEVKCCRLCNNPRNEQGNRRELDELPKDTA